MASLRKGDIASRVATKLGSSRAEGDAALSSVLECISDALAAGDRVVLTGFGSFDVREVKPRQVRSIGSPDSGDLVTVPAHKRAGFKPGAELNRAAEG